MLSAMPSEVHGGNGGLGGIRAASSTLSSEYVSGGEGGQRGEGAEERLGLRSEGELDGSIVSRTTRVQMQRSMALCCLGIMLQHQ